MRRNVRITFEMMSIPSPVKDASATSTGHQRLILFRFLSVDTNSSIRDAIEARHALPKIESQICLHGNGDNLNYSHPRNPDSPVYSLGSSTYSWHTDLHCRLYANIAMSRTAWGK